MRAMRDRMAKRAWTGVMVAAGAALSLGSLAGGELEPNLKDLESPDAAVRAALVEKLRTAGARAVDPLAKLLSSESRSVTVAAGNALNGIAHHAARPGAGNERAEVARALAGAYARAERVGPRNAIAEVLSLVGGEESVPALAAALSDLGSREMARFALARIPVPGAARALREALEREGDPEFQVALVNALGLKRDPEAVKLLALQVEKGTEEVRLSAIEALSRIPAAGPEVGSLLKALSGSAGGAEARARLRVFDSLLVLGETLLRAGKREEAQELYRRLLERAAESHERCAAIVGVGRAGGESALLVLVGNIEDPDEEIQGAARVALRGMPAPEGLQTIARVLKEANSSSLRASLLGVLAERKEREAAALALSSLKDRDASVRAAALRALEGREDPEVVRGLLGAVLAGEPAAREGAVGVLGRLPGEAATREIVTAARAAPGEARAFLLSALGQREDAAALPVLLEAAVSDSPAVRAAAYEGLGRLRRAEALPLLLGGLDRGAEERGSAERALLRLSSSEATRALVEAARKKAGPAKASLLRVAGKRESPEVLGLLLEAARDPDEEVRIAALEALSSQRDPAVMPVLLAAAESGPEKVRPAAILGCLRFGRAIEERDRKAALAIYHKALLIGGRREEKAEALQGIARLADPGSLAVVKPFLLDRDRMIRERAAAAILPIALKVGETQKEEAVAALRAALPLVAGSPDARAATEALRRFGVDYDIAREAGFITRWWLLGPFPNPENKMFEGDFLDPEVVTLEALATAEVKSGERALRWKHHYTADPQGIVNLEEAVARLDGVGSYAFAEVTVPEEKRVSFKVGSDDSVVVWLNGKKIHEQKTSRGLAVDQDTVNTRLVSGRNRILLKVLNAGAQWAFCLRITDRQGAPLELKQPER